MQLTKTASFDFKSWGSEVQAGHLIFLGGKRSGNDIWVLVLDDEAGRQMSRKPIAKYAYKSTLTRWRLFDNMSRWKQEWVVITTKNWPNVTYGPDSNRFVE